MIVPNESTMSILRWSVLSSRNPRAFTVLELLVVIAIIIVLAGLILATTGYVQNKGARSRAEAEIAAMSAALESYKADNGIYPRDGTTDTLNTRSPNSGDYAPASLYLYTQLSGNTANRQPNGSAKFWIQTKYAYAQRPIFECHGDC